MLIKRNNARRKGYWPGLLSAFLLRPSSFLLFCEFVLLFLFCLCLLVPLVSSLFFCVCFASLFLCWFALFFSWSRPPPFSVTLSLSCRFPLFVFFFLRLCLFFVSPGFQALFFFFLPLSVFCSWSSLFPQSSASPVFFFLSSVLLFFFSSSLPLREVAFAQLL